ncbi:MAG: DNA-processing protein DprA [Anaerolineae bacterium]|nr:DNA-processing protein DprA [Anaerolineae bacterium]
MNSKASWVGFNHVKGIGSVRFRALLDYFGDAEIAWQAPADGLKAAGLPQRAIENLLRIRNSLDLDAIMTRIEKQKILILTWNDSNYPAYLKQIDQPPPVIYVKGEISARDDWAVAVVGTRRVTAYGRQVAAELSRFLVQNGITVVSGLARGVDSIAHETSLSVPGRTLAVLGCGVDRIYPPENNFLAEKIVENGALISDYAPGTPPDAANFPPRNRIIAGLSRATIVIEAGQESGALITAAFAVDQGRDVFAVPGSIYAPQSKGTNRLIQQGAIPLIDYSQLLECLNIQQAPQQQVLRLAFPANEIEADILNSLSLEPLHIDEIGQKSGLPINQVSATLAMMELKGMVRQVGGMNYVLVRENNSLIYRASQND